MRKLAIAIGCALLLAGPAAAQEGPKLTIGGTTYTKWLWGTQRDQGAMYNFTTVPGEGYGDNGQGTELELLLDGKLSRQVAFGARLHSRFSQNEWTNFGGFGGSLPPITIDRDGSTVTGARYGSCTGGSCGEFDPRSNQYVKLRGVKVVLTPGYGWIDSVSIGQQDLGQFDPFVIGKIRYIDRDNAGALLFQGSAMNRQLTWDLIRVSLPRLWAGPSYSTGNWNATDAAYGGQLKFAPNPMWDAGLIAEWVNDQELDVQRSGLNIDYGRGFRQRFANAVGGGKFSVRPGGGVEVRGQGYYSWSHAYTPYAGKDYDGIAGFGPTLLGRHEDWAGKVNVNLTEPLGVSGLTVNLEAFNIGKDYVSMMAARRESDVLLTEGHDATFAFPGPSNAAFGVFGGNATRIGYGGWSGNAQQVATINVDNEFSDFDEPMAETVIGWKGITIAPNWSSGPLEIGGEYTLIGYNTNWQAWGHPEKSLNATTYPGLELDTGVGHNFRSAYAPFQDKMTHIAVVRAKYTLDFLKGIDTFGRVKFIKETDKRMKDSKYLPYQADGVTPNPYNGNGDSTSGLYSIKTSGTPAVPVFVTGANGVQGPQWKPFNDLADDDRDLTYWAFTVGAGYQIVDELYLSLAYNKYLADLKDGNTAFQGYNLHEMASGKHDKNQFVLKARYVLAGIEFGLEGQFSFGTFKPDFGKQCSTNSTNIATADCYVPTRLTSNSGNGFTPGTLGFAGRFGGWNSLETRNFEEWRLKTFMKAQF